MLEGTIKDGGFYNIEEARHLVSFYGGQSKIRGVQDTDIDGVRAYHRNLFVFKEGKKVGVQPSQAQRLFFQDLIISLRDGNHMAFYIIYEHNVPTTDIIYQKDQYVREYYNGKRWIKPKTPLTVDEAHLKFEECAIKKGIKL